ncbi:DUF2569 domain-containing protein [Siccibacter colletis]|uniref:DUF2569 domain-containing protein n=1 Tax=Siccibacter colletis TaxID=1505757 RepID=A0ABY6JI57_9ENTR|nr:DUF2569 domain-containing protein [Siccibacter colletis]UYU33520.1 DUF2569 domain-containing protein [Siccibacter colletis]
MSTTPTTRIGGWLLAPLAWLLLTLLSTSLGLVVWFMAIISPRAHQMLSEMSTQNVVLWYLSMATAVAVWIYTLWLSVAFFKRRALVRKHYIIWLLVCVLLALKSFAFSPVNDEIAVSQLILPLLAAALMAPYFRYAQRVKNTFVNP